jgi:hypothetical protein
MSKRDRKPGEKLAQMQRNKRPLSVKQRQRDRDTKRMSDEEQVDSLTKAKPRDK